jgi:cytochrome c-type protein NapC/trimethylamine-N-oxide reductase cytochrome c-type subunit TorC
VYPIADNATSGDRSAGRARSSWRWLWISLAVLGVLVLVTTGFAYGAASPALCATCHEMQPQVDAWQTSGHNKVGCVSCHETPREWYQLPQTLGSRASLLARDVGLHLAGDGESASAPHDDMSSDIPDSTCLSCHNTAREVTMRYGTLIDHDEHAERNDSCVSCHRWTGHPDPAVERALLVMSQCFACHGRAAEDEAPGTCDVCHPADFELAPASHELESEWTTGHGTAAIDETEDCAMCHDEIVCADCHGVAMPHPAAWNEGDSTHGAASQGNLDVCTRCHPDPAEFCAGCHHKEFDPADGPWIELHPVAVRENGTASCLECHEPTHCVSCHTAFPPAAPGALN